MAWGRGPDIAKFVLVLTPGLLAKREDPCGYLYPTYFKEKTVLVFRSEHFGEIIVLYVSACLRNRVISAFVLDDLF